MMGREITEECLELMTVFKFTWTRKNQMNTQINETVLQIFVANQQIKLLLHISHVQVIGWTIVLHSGEHSTDVNS